MLSANKAANDAGSGWTTFVSGRQEYAEVYSWADGQSIYFWHSSSCVLDFVNAKGRRCVVTVIQLWSPFSRGDILAYCQFLKQNHYACLGRAQGWIGAVRRIYKPRFLPFQSPPAMNPAVQLCEWSGVGCSQRCCNTLLAHVKLM